MFNHLYTNAVPPQRVVILGAGGFVGSTAMLRLQQAKLNVLGLGRAELDLLQDKATEKLAAILQPNDTLVIAVAEAPCKNYIQLDSNIKMMRVICDALVQSMVTHIIYISSDAVYIDSPVKLTESSPTAPSSLHGIMHLAREKMLESIMPISSSLAILRPSLLYGINDPHNGYGPNSFYRLALAGKVIELFGKGEEQRDHVYIDDLAEIIYQCITRHSHGVLNITTGQILSFYEVAEAVIQTMDHPVAIRYRSRTGPMPHNGYRAFDTTIFRQLFPNIQFRSLKNGLAAMRAEKEYATS